MLHDYISYMNCNEIGGASNIFYDARTGHTYPRDPTLLLHPTGDKNDFVP